MWVSAPTKDLQGEKLTAFIIHAIENKTLSPKSGRG
jgi:hypothetical protein